MKKATSRKGTNLVEYALIAVFVGIVGGYALYLINPEIFINYFGGAFTNSSHSGSTITLGAME